MSELPFPYTVQGRRFFEQSVPDAIAVLDRLNATLVELINAIERTPPARPDPGHFAPGSLVLIRDNPFNDDAVDITGTVVEFQPGAGVMGADLVTVRYERPRDGTVHERPFAASKLDHGGTDALVARAVRHEQQARKLRAMAQGARKQSVPVSRAVFDGIEAVRRDGRTNMLDRPVVAELADELGYPDAARWVRENRALYAQAVFRGFEVTDGTGGDEPPQPNES